MSLPFVIVPCVIAILLVTITVARTRLKKRSFELSEKIGRLSSYGRGRAGDRQNHFNGGLLVGIAADLSSSFYHTVISTRQATDFTNHYTATYVEALSVIRQLKRLYVTSPDSIVRFIRDYESIDTLVKRHNESVISYLLDTHKEFFDYCLRYPLDKQQRRSIVSEEDNCLVVSSAGSGKTSSIVGKVKYLTEVKGVDPQRILLISYTNKAAAELTERIATDGLRGYTFHKLAIDLIGRTTGVKPSICDNTDALFVEIYHALLEEHTFKRNIVEYFVDYRTSRTDSKQWEDDRRQMLSEQKDTRLRAMFPDMDGRTVYVRSEQEQKICFALSSLGIKFRYEEPYEHQLADETHSQYRPDFSIYFEQDGAQRRIYLEHFGVDEHGLTPAWFAKDKNISCEEANRRYNDGITWKKAAHAKFGTTLLVTSSADFHYSDIRSKLKGLLMDAGVPIQEKTSEELYDQVLPKGSKQEKAFIRLVAAFVTLSKSSCRSVAEALFQARRANDERSSFIIRNIIQPVFERYVRTLADRGQIDFTDAILQAAEICRSSHPVEYGYIIVDEFQDISIDRYNFLKELRKGDPPAKLYCVGDDWQSIYRFSGSDMALFSEFPKYFGATEINKIETTYRFGEPLISLSSHFIQRNKSQTRKDVRSFNPALRTTLEFHPYDKEDYCDIVGRLVAAIPPDKSVLLLGRYSFDDYYLSFTYESVKERNKFFYVIGDRKIEYLTVHKSKGLEADYVILLQCNKDTYGFPSLINDDPVLDYVLTQGDPFPFGEERRLFYVAITRAKTKTIVLYDKRSPSVFVREFSHP